MVEMARRDTRPESFAIIMENTLLQKACCPNRNFFSSQNDGNSGFVFSKSIILLGPSLRITRSRSSTTSENSNFLIKVIKLSNLAKSLNFRIFYLCNVMKHGIFLSNKLKCFMCYVFNIDFLIQCSFSFMRTNYIDYYYLFIQSVHFFLKKYVIIKKSIFLKKDIFLIKILLLFN